MNKRTILALTGVVACVLAGVSSPASAARPAPDVQSPLARASTALSLNAAAVAASTGDQFTMFRSVVDPDGATHVRYTRTYHGLAVYGGDVIVHLTRAGAFAGASNGLAAPISLSTVPTVTPPHAATAAAARFAGTVSAVGPVQLVVDAADGRGRLAWDVTVSGSPRDGQSASRLRVLVDARSGTVIRQWDAVESVALPAGQGRTIYSGNVTIDTTNLGGFNWSLVDPIRGNSSVCDMNNATSSCTTFTDTDNVWGNNSNSNRQSAGADAAYGAALTWDYYKYVHGHTGIWAGAGVPNRVHYGNGFRNAQWDETLHYVIYGDNTGNARPLVAIDVVAHELTHAVTQSLVPNGLTYAGESGGLNESTSDIFGTMVEFSANNATDPADYTIGEKINYNNDGKPLRYMYDPHKDGTSYNCWFSGIGNSNPHQSSGVGNHFYFMLAQGSGTTTYGTSPVCGSAPAVTGIGRAEAEKIWYRALDVYFTSNTAYVNTANPANTARAYTLQAATDLYGYCGTEYKAVQAAWTAVTVAGSDAVCPTPLSVYIDGPGNIPQKGTYTFTAIYSGFNANPSFGWSERFCTDSGCSSWGPAGGNSAVLTRTLSHDCSGSGNNDYELELVMTNSDGRTATANHTAWLCLLP